MPDATEDATPEATDDVSAAASRPLFDVSDADLDDLRTRLLGTRWPKPWPVDPWVAGTDDAELRRLVEYWATGYDWRRHEVEINALPSHFADIDGTRVHYLRFDAEVADAPAIVITHGWPSSVLELVGLAQRLSEPSRFGGDAGDAFTVIVPALPGLGFSPQRPEIPAALPTFELWHRLMHNELGFERYAVHGGDVGSGVSARLGQAHPEAVVGIHVLSVADPADVDEATLTPAEREHNDAIATWIAYEGGYAHEQSTRPVTLGYGLSDSPAGLLAWIVEKYRAWSDNHGDLSSRFDDDFILTQASLYWFTNSISSSFRSYYEGLHHPVVIRDVTVPTAVALFPGDIAQPPRSWAERSYNVQRFTVMPRGGHFAAHEEPELLAADITEFFRGRA